MTKLNCLGYFGDTSTVSSMAFLTSKINGTDKIQPPKQGRIVSDKLIF